MSVQPNAFSQSEHRIVTTSQIKKSKTKQNPVSAPNSSALAPSQSQPILPFLKVTLYSMNKFFFF